MSEEIERLMRHNGYTRRGGALRQTHVGDHGEADEPEHCLGCAWAPIVREAGRACGVFNDRWRPWLDARGECEAHARPERRREIERAMAAYRQAREASR